MPISSTTTYAPSKQRLVRLVTIAVGAAFLGVGILGFVPGVTTGVDSMTFAGHTGEAELLGIFEVSVLHNLVHLAYGAVGLVVAARPLTAITYLLVGGAGYLVLWVYGLAIAYDSDANFLPLNSADNWLHLVLGAAMVGAGLALQVSLRGSLTVDRPL